MADLTQAALIEELLEEQGEALAPEVRERMATITDALRTNRREEINAPNIRADEPNPGVHPGADAARAASPTGDLPRTDIAPPTPPEEIVAPHDFAKIVRRSQPARVAAGPSVADLNPDQGSAFASGAARANPDLVAQMAGSRAMPSLPTVEHAVGS